MLWLVGLNHLFQNCRIYTPTEYSQIEGMFAPSALALIADRPRVVSTRQRPATRLLAEQLIDATLERIVNRQSLHICKWQELHQDHTGHAA